MRIRKAKKSSKKPTKTIQNQFTNQRDTYEINYKRVLGSGAFGKVYIAKCVNKQEICAVKITEKLKNKRAKQALEQEINFLTLLNHVNVINMRGSIEEHGKFFIFMDKMCCNLVSEISATPNNRLSSRTCRFIVRQIAAGIKYLHDLDISHCDLKPDNILLDGKLSKSKHWPPCVKLCDFGYARFISRVGRRKSVKGTKYYAAPEVLANQKHDRSCDIWSLGVTIFVALSGKFPFVGADKTRLKADQERKLNSSSLLYFNEAFRVHDWRLLDLMNLLLTKVTPRIKIDEVIQHPWMISYRLHKDMRKLEERLNLRYLTTVEDSQYWSRIRARRKAIL